MINGWGGGIFPHHIKLLQASKITPEHARARGYVTVATRDRLEELGFAEAGCNPPGLLVPLLGKDGTVQGYQYRPDHPRLNGAGKPVKYETPVGQRNVIDVPPGVGPKLGDPSIPLLVTEGSRKADAAVCAGLACFALLGVWNWRGTNASGGKTAISDWDDIALNGRRVVLAFDSDVVRKKSVRLALDRMASYLTSKGAKVEYLHLPDNGAGKTGLDDYLADGHTADDLWNLVRRRPPEAESESPAEERRRFIVRPFADIHPRTSTWLLPGVVPDDELVVLVGEEGIGKGLFSVDVIARVTRAGHNVLIIATEDDFETALRPRLDVAGADVGRCIFMVEDDSTLQGQPHFPRDLEEVRQVINQHRVRLVYIDPWVSSVSGGLRLRDTQDARRAIDPLLQLARTAHCSMLAVAHPNRGEGDLRAKVGLTAVLRQVARLLLFAIEPPDDDSRLIVGIEKANAAERTPAAVYRKVPRQHPSLPEPVWALEEIPNAQRLTIRQWHDRYRTDRDHRTTDRWPQVLAAADQGLVQRADIIEIYEESGSSEAAANKAITRWLNKGQLVQRGSGVYELDNR